MQSTSSTSTLSFHSAQEYCTGCNTAQYITVQEITVQDTEWLNIMYNRISQVLNKTRIKEDRMLGQGNLKILRIFQQEYFTMEV